MVGESKTFILAWALALLLVLVAAPEALASGAQLARAGGSTQGGNTLVAWLVDFAGGAAGTLIGNLP